MALADELARQQRSISVAEFFEKNKHLLGFDSPARGIITTIKEAVDNALDACEEALVLPDIFIAIRKVSPEVYSITVEDNGPGIVPGQIPFVFGKLLYGSRFHQIRQSRGQQGIGISAAVLYAQLTTGQPTIVTSRTSSQTPAVRAAIQIQIETNEPEVVSQEEIPWDRTHGTRIEIRFRSSLAAKKRLMEYLRYTSVVNPHARIRLEIDDESMVFERTSDDPIPVPAAIQPHPHGIELGQLKRMAAASPLPLARFLEEGFSRVGKKSAAEMITAAGLLPGTPADTLRGEDLGRLLSSMQAARIPAPPAGQCLSPIGEALLMQSLEREFPMDFAKTRTRPAGVHSGHPFVVEAALGYGGKLPAEGNAQVLRFANRVPLMYQQGACAITSCISSITWKTYNVSQSGLPQGPLLILIHVASTNVPFTSESKDAIASIPEIEREITLALQELGRDLKLFLSRRDRSRVQEDRARAICAILPEIAAKVGEIVEMPPPDISSIEGRIMHRCVVKRRSDAGRTVIEIANYTPVSGPLSLYFISPEPPGDPTIPPALVSAAGDDHTAVWQLEISPGSRFETSFRAPPGGIIEIRGIPPDKVLVVNLDEHA